MNWTPVAKVEEVAPGKAKIVTVGKREIGVFHEGGRYYALLNYCPHAGAPICQGKVSGYVSATPATGVEYDADHLILRCPWHRWEFNLADGKPVIDMPGKLKTFPVRVTDDNVIEVGV